MIIILFSIILLLGQDSFGQMSISMGLTRMHEGLDNDFEVIFDKSSTRLYLNDYITAKVNVRKTFWGYFGELMFLPGGATVTQFESNYTGGGSSPSHWERYEYNSTVNFSYLALKGGADFIIEDKSNSGKDIRVSFYTSPFMQFDFKTNHTEKNHSITKTYSSYGLTGTTQYTITDPPLYVKFETVALQQILIQCGLDFKGRLNYRTYFVELGFSVGGGIGGYRTERLHSKLDGRPYNTNQHEWFNFCGSFKIGYCLPNK